MTLFPDLTPVQDGFTFPQPLTEKYRPGTVQAFAGLEKPKAVLAPYVAHPYDCGWLFKGSAGTGKTSLALAMASDMRAELHHIRARKCTLEEIERVAFACHYYPMSPNVRHLVLVDEADRMSSAAQDVLLSYLDGTATVPGTTWVFTCNSTDGLEERFVSRNRVVEFSTYRLSGPATSLLENVWENEAPSKPKPNFARIVKDAGNNIRAALMALEMEIMAEVSPCL